MPVIKFDGIAEKSSEDSKRQLFADNLLRTSDFKSWKCQDWQEMTFVVLELKEPQKVDNIEIGNDCSAFIEVLVANSSDLKPRFQVLLSTSSFMTPSESKSLNNTNRIREFPKEKLSPNSRNEKWDRFKIVCKQPFNREISYGLAFVRFNYKEDDEPEEDMTPKLAFGPFKLRSAENKDNDTESETNSGSLFAKRNNTTNNISKPPTLASAVGLTSSSPKPSKPKQNMDPSNGLTSKQSSPPKTSQIKRQTIPKTPNPSPSTSSNQRQSVRSPPKRQRISAQKKPFDQMMSGIVFSLSGFVNPKRSEIRDKAIQMGAKYRPDWDQSCTHLVCAFENTPKFREVKTRKGRIVTEKWILDSFNQKKLISWKKYILGQTSDDEEDDDDIEDDIDDQPYVPPVQTNRKQIQYIDDEEEEEEEDSQIREVIGFDGNKQTDNDLNDEIYDMETDNE